LSLCENGLSSLCLGTILSPFSKSRPTVVSCAGPGSELFFAEADRRFSLYDDRLSQVSFRYESTKVHQHRLTSRFTVFFPFFFLFTPPFQTFLLFQTMLFLDNSPEISLTSGHLPGPEIFFVSGRYGFFKGSSFSPPCWSSRTRGWRSFSSPARDAVQ